MEKQYYCSSKYSNYNYVALSVYVYAGNVYVSGSSRIGNSSRAVYWKNGIITTLPNSGSDSNGVVNRLTSGSSIFVNATGV